MAYGVSVILPGGGINYPTLAGAMYAIDRRVRVGCVTGTSAGGLIASAYASGHDLKAAVRMSTPLSRHLMRRWAPWRFPPSLYQRPPIRRLLGRILPGTIQDVNCDLNVVTADLVSRKQVILSSTDPECTLPLADAAYATMAVPGMMPPLRHNGGLLVDGGITSNRAVDDVEHPGPKIILVLEDQGPPQRPTTLAEYFGACLTTAINHNEAEDMAEGIVIKLPARTDSLDLTALTERQAMRQFAQGYRITYSKLNPYLAASLRAFVFARS